MQYLNYRGIFQIGLVMLACFAGPLRALAAGCWVSDGSVQMNDDGVNGKLAFVYDGENGCKLVVVDIKKQQRYEAPLNETKEAPFWDDGKVYAPGNSGKIQGFSMGPDKLVPEKEELRIPNIGDGAVFWNAFDRSQRRLYVIITRWDKDHREFYHELSAIAFPGLQTLWVKKIDYPGILEISNAGVSIMARQGIQLFNCDTGEKVGGIDTTNAP